MRIDLWNQSGLGLSHVDAAGITTFRSGRGGDSFLYLRFFACYVASYNVLSRFSVQNYALVRVADLFLRLIQKRFKPGRTHN